MIRRPPRSTRTDTLFPTRRSSDLYSAEIVTLPPEAPTRAGTFVTLGKVKRTHQTTVMFTETVGARSEEHTSELQSLMRISYAVFCLKKKKRTTANNGTADIPKKYKLQQA